MNSMEIFQFAMLVITSACISRFGVELFEFEEETENVIHIYIYNIYIYYIYTQPPGA